VAAYDRLNPKPSAATPAADPCATIRSKTITRADRDAFWRAAEVAGDPVAQVRSFQCSLEGDSFALVNEKDPNRMVALMDENRERSTMNAEKIERYKTLLAQSTNETIVPLIQMLASTYPNGFFTLEDEAILGSQPRVSGRLSRVVSCELKQNCEKGQTWELDEACAYKGRCDAGNIEDYWRFYILSPLQAQVLESQRAAMLKIIQTRDLSTLKFVSRPSGSLGDEEYSGGFSSSFSCY
jgi:hypothetical protein